MQFPYTLLEDANTPFFTVYGPKQRPDLAINKFTRLMLEGKEIPMFGDGTTSRDYTYIDDIVEGILCVLNHIATPSNTWDACHPDPATSTAPYRIYNIGNSRPIQLMDFIAAIEQACGHKSIKEFLPMQPGDVYQTYADTTLLETEMGYRPNMSITEGVKKTVDWYKTYLQYNHTQHENYIN